MAWMTQRTRHGIAKRIISSVPRAATALARRWAHMKKRRPDALAGLSDGA